MEMFGAHVFWRFDEINGTYPKKTPNTNLGVIGGDGDAAHDGYLLLQLCYVLIYPSREQRPPPPRILRAGRTRCGGAVRYPSLGRTYDK